MYTEIRFTLNGEQKLYQGDPLRRLLDVLREDYGLTGSKEGCGEGECGACSIIKNGELVTSCIIPVGAVNGCGAFDHRGHPRHGKGQVHHRRLRRGRRGAVRLLHPWHGHGDLCAAE